MRNMINLGQGWRFIKEANGPAEAYENASLAVTIPHTWNAEDGQDGGNDYHRGTCWYVRALTKEEMTPSEENGRIYLDF